MENLSTTQHAERISESVINGQHKQALEQFEQAMYYTYKGVTIWRNTSGGYALRYTATANGNRLAADTLQGIKQLINSNF